MIGQAQSQPVGLTAQRRAFRPGRIARRMGQGQDAANHFRTVGAEHDFQFRLFSQGAGGMAQRALEGFGGSIRGGHAFS